MLTQKEFSRIMNQEEDCSSTCPLMYTLSVISGKWKMPVIYQLSKRNSWRFCELQKTIQGITNAMLVSVLRSLEADGIVIRKESGSSNVEYSLTERGKALGPLFYEMTVWGMNYRD